MTFFGLQWSNRLADRTKRHIEEDHKYFFHADQQVLSFNKSCMYEINSSDYKILQINSKLACKILSTYKHRNWLQKPQIEHYAL